MAALYINEEQASSLISMEKTLELVEESFKDYAEGKAFGLPRQRMRIRKGALHMLPGAIPHKGVIGFKAYTSFKAGLIFKTHLYDAETGTPLAIVESNEIGRLRTGAAGGVAARYLARKNSETAFIFGAGFQAEAQLEALLGVIKLKKIIVASRSFEKAADFASRVSRKLEVETVPSENIKKDMGEADIIVTVTTSSEPLFDHSWIMKPGVHINAAGSNALIRREIPEKTVEKAKYVVVDSKEVAAIECGDILPSLEKGRLHWNEITELGDIAAGFRPGRTENESLSLFESQGMGLQDIVCAEYVYRKALEKGIGEKLPF